MRWTPVFAWAAIVVLVSVLSGRAMPGYRIPGIDKVAHFVMYAVLAALAMHAARKPCLSCGAIVTASCGLLGGLLELAQAFLPGRSMSLADALMNVAGAAVASAAYVGWTRRRGRA